MRRLDSLELDRAINEVVELVKEGRLTQEQGAPVVRAFFARGMTEEAELLFEQSCKRLAAALVVVEVVEAGDVPIAFVDDDPSEVGYDPYAGQELEDDVPDYDEYDYLLGDD